MPARLRGAVIGVGHMGRHHARKLQARDDVDVVLVDADQGHLPAPPPGLDFAVVATPTRTHAEIALPLLAAGVACLVEKPLAATLADARALAAFPRLSVGHVERYNPALAGLSGVRPAFVECTRLAPWQAPRAGARGTDVDVVADLMLHDLDLVCGWLPGPVVDVRAVGVGVLSGGVDIVDARLEVEGGATAVLRASRISPAPVRTVRLFAPGRYWSIDLLARKAHTVAWEGAEGPADLAPTPLPVPQADALESELDTFLAAVRGERAFPVSGEQAVAALTLVERVQAALGGGPPG